VAILYWLYLSAKVALTDFPRAAENYASSHANFQFSVTKSDIAQAIFVRAIAKTNLPTTNCNGAFANFSLSFANKDYSAAKQNVSVENY
jgi:hypothetical protein